MEIGKINIRDLASKILEVFTYKLFDDQVCFDVRNSDDIDDLIMERIEPITPLGYIIKDGCFEHLKEELNVHLLLALKMKLDKVVKGFDKEERKVGTAYDFCIEVEKDGY